MSWLSGTPRLFVSNETVGIHHLKRFRGGLFGHESIFELGWVDKCAL
jgi:hypothetical protein